MPNSAYDNGVVGIGTLQARAFAMQPDGKLLFAAAFRDGAANTFGMFRLPPPPAPVAPVITVQPVSKTIGAGETLSLNVTATSESPLTYQWRHSSTNLPRATNQFLDLYQLPAERAGDFTVVVSNPFGSVTSQVATVTVRPPAQMVMIQQPVGGTVKLSQPFSLSAQCSSEVATGHQWYKDGTALPTGAGTGSGFASLNLPAGDTTRMGDYFVVITNAFDGSVTSKVAHIDLILPGPPQITSQPADLMLFPGQPVQLAVTALADGLVTYQWQHSGTNLLRSATVPNVNASSLFIQGTDLNRGGAYSVIASVNPGGSTTSRVAQVTLLPSGPPVLLMQPTSVPADLGQSTNFTAVFNGEAPVTVYWRHAGTNLLASFGTYPTLPGPQPSTFPVPVVPSTAGDYQFVVSNRWGAVTSTVATLTVRPLPPATLVKDLADLTIGIGEFNTVGLRADKNGLVITNCCGLPETTHILQLTSAGGITPFSGSGTWHLAIGAGGRYYVGAQHGVATTTGTWGPVPGAIDFLGLFLTNFPKAGVVTRFEALDDGLFGMKAVGGSAGPGNESGTFRVLGQRRPATNFLSFELVSGNGTAVAWYKDGQLLTVNPPSSPGHLTLLNESLGGLDQRTRLTITDVVPEDAGKYQAVISSLVRNPDTSFGQPTFIVASVSSTRTATLTVKGYAEEHAPQVVAATESGSPSGGDEVAAMAVGMDGAAVLGTRSTSLGSGFSQTHQVSRFTADGLVDWQVSNVPAAVRAVLPDGTGGAIVGGHDDRFGGWYLRRIRPLTIVAQGRTNVIATNLWHASVEAPSTNAVVVGTEKNAEIFQMLPASDGLLVAGRFRGSVRFGATNRFILADQVYVPLGGVTLTNASVGNDRLWDLYVAKYDLAGRMLWARAYGGTNDEQLTSFAADGAGNLYLGGAFKARTVFGALGVDATKVVQSATVTQYGTDGFVAKLDPEGQPQWVRNYGGTNNSFIADTSVTSIAAGTDGVFFTAARSANTTFLQPGLPATPAYLARLNPAGELLWTQEFPLVNALLATDAAGNAVVAGSVPQGNLLGGLTFGAGSFAPPPFAGTALAKFNPAGSLLWFRALDEKLPFADDPRPATAQRIAFAPDDALVVAGRLPGGTSSSASRTSGQRLDLFELPSTNTMNANSTDVFIARLAPKFEPVEPRITRAPVSQTGLLQDRLVLEGGAAGSPAPTFQWLVNGVPLPGATNRLLTFPELSRTNRGSYSLVASNAFGAITSAPVDVTPKLRPEMTGWTLVTSTTNYLGNPGQAGRGRRWQHLRPALQQRDRRVRDQPAEIRRGRAV